jgi:hypothetical protein
MHTRGRGAGYVSDMSESVMSVSEREIKKNIVRSISYGKK